MSAIESKVGSIDSILDAFTLSAFWSRKLNPKIPSASGFAFNFWTIKLSFSPASM